MTDKNQRANEFLECLGNGMSFYEIEAENEIIDEMLEEQSK